MNIEFNKELYMDQCLLFFSFLFRKKQWSGFSNADYTRWINNFEQIEDGKYIATRILDFMLYYSEDDMLRLLDDAIMGIFENEIVLPAQIENNFSQLPTDLEFAVNDAISKTIVMPLIEDLKDPGASGPEIIRQVRNHFWPRLQTAFHYALPQTATHERLILLDDCIGSGEQCKEFWETAEMSQGKLLREWVSKNGIKAYYVALVGYRKAVHELRHTYPDLEIICAEYIDDQHQVFSENSRCWCNKDEQTWAAGLLEDKAKENGIALKGHGDLSFAVALHKTIPDWSLPVLYKNKNDWKHLVERKTTYD